MTIFRRTFTVPLGATVSNILDSGETPIVGSIMDLSTWTGDVILLQTSVDDGVTWLDVRKTDGTAAKFAGKVGEYNTHTGNSLPNLRLIRFKSSDTEIAERTLIVVFKESSNVGGI